MKNNQQTIGNGQRKKNIVKVMVVTSIMLILVAMMFIPIGTANAGSWVAGTLNYDGSINHCHYNIVAASNLASDHKFSESGFKVVMQGVSCARNIWTTFTYDVDFTLKKGTDEVDTYALDFKISAAKDIEKVINNPTMFESSSLSGKGAYTLSWTGRIKSNVTAEYSGSYNFEIV